MHVLGGGLVAVVLLQQQEHHPVRGERPVDGFDRHTTADAEGRHRHRQHDCAAKRHDRQFSRKRGSDRNIGHV